MRRVDWNPAAEAVLAEAAGSPSELAEVAAEVRAGDSQLWALSEPCSGYAVLRLEQAPTGSTELVLVLGGGTNTRALIDQFKQWVIEVGADSGRVHLTSPALERIFYHRDFRRTGVVMNWRPDDGQ